MGSRSSRRKRKRSGRTGGPKKRRAAQAGGQPGKRTAETRRPRARVPVVVDERPIRNAAVRKCRYILGQFDRVGGELEKHDTVDRPAYLAWYHRTFGQALTELRELSDEIRYRKTVLDTIEYLRRWYRLGRYEAYHQARHIVDHPEEYEHDADDDAGENAYERYDDSWEHDDEAGFEGSNGDHGFEEELAALLEEMIRSVPGFEDLDRDSPEFRRAYEELRAACFGGDHGESHWRNHSRNGEQREPDDSPTDGERGTPERVKSLYRNLAKRLHPDNRIGAGTPDRVLDELWYRAQDAYRGSDLEALQSIHAGLEVRAGTDFSSLPVSDVLAVHADYKAELRALRRRHRSLSQEPSWGFTHNSPQERDDLRADLEAKLQRETAEARSYRDHLDRVLEEYAQPHRSRKASRGRRKAEEVPEGQLSLF